MLALYRHLTLWPCPSLAGKTRTYNGHLLAEKRDQRQAEGMDLELFSEDDCADTERCEPPTERHALDPRSALYLARAAAERGDWELAKFWNQYADRASRPFWCGGARSQ